MAESYMSGSFPSQVVPDKEKLSEKYGLQIGKAIEQEWFKRDSGTNRFASNQNNFHNIIWTNFLTNLLIQKHLYNL